MRYCMTAGCSSLAVDGSYYCQKHRQESKDRYWSQKQDNRPSALERYGPNWSLLRARTLNKYPRCVLCGSTDKLRVHHKVPVIERPDMTEQEDNLVTLCTICHGKIHGRMKAEHITWNQMMHQKGRHDLYVNDGSAEFKGFMVEIRQASKP